MALRINPPIEQPQTKQIEYVLAPWHLRLRWLLLAGFWRVVDLFAPIVEESPEQQNPLWQKR